jgi:hypothetical protein
MDILQKQDLAATSFANDNTNAAGGLTIRTDAGSTVGAAITAATPDATTAVKGLVELATVAETPTLDAVRAITPEGFTTTLAANTAVATTGASRVGFLQQGVGAVGRTLQDRGEDWVSVKDFGAVGDGVTDDSLAFLNAANTGKLIFVPVGTYSLNIQNLPSNSRLYGCGSTSIIKPLTDTVRCALGAESTSASTYIENIHLSGLRFLGNVASVGFSEQDHLTAFNGVKNLLIEKCEFIGFRGDGIYIGSGNSGANELHNVNVTIKNNFFDGVNNDNRNGVSVVDGDGVTISDNYFINCTRSNMPGAIDIEPNSNIYHVAKNVKIHNNKFFNIGGNVAAISIFLPAITPTEPYTGFDISGNYIDTCTAAGVLFGHYPSGGATATSPSHNVTVKDNTVFNSFRPISILAGKDVSVIDNTFTDSAQPALFSFTTVANTLRDLRVINNTFTRCGALNGNGVSAYHLTNAIFANNRFVDNGAGVSGGANAITFNTGVSTNIQFFNNTFSSPTGQTQIAIQKEAAHTFTASTNTFYGNTLNGLTNNFQFSANEAAVAQYRNEGTSFTPTIYGGTTAGTATYTTQSGFYTRVGKLVYFNITLVWTGHTGVGHATITMPLSVNINSQTLAPISSLSTGITIAAGGQLNVMVNKNNATAVCYILNAGSLSPLNVSASGTLYLSGCYLSA